MKPLWLPIVFLTHQEKNNLRNIHRWFQHFGKLLPKEKEHLNEWNECVVKVKWDKLRSNYFAQ